MVRDLNINKKDELRRELKNQFPELTNDDFNSVDISIDELANDISAKTHRDKKEIEKLLVDRLEFINSKHLI